MKRVLVIGNKEICRNENYYLALEACGAFPVACDFSKPEESVSNTDMVLIPGGPDVNPSLYGEQNTASCAINDVLDAVDMAAIQTAVQQGKPILGICRGLQILNVFFGGTLIQNIESTVQHRRIDDVDSAHDTFVEKDSFLYKAFSSERLVVNSAHHQAIKKLGKNLRVVQRCTDSTIEAVQHETLPIIAVQWHPERTCLANERPDTINALPLFDYWINGTLIP